MTTDKIKKLFAGTGLGSPRLPITPVSGGFLHRMYRVDTETGSFAVKHLNPDMMSRPSAMDNLKRAEALESVLEAAGLPIVPALELGGTKMQEVDGSYFYVFRWQNGTVSDSYRISPAQCRLAGAIQGRIHALAPKQISKPEPEASAVDWNGLIEEAAAACPSLEKLLTENLDLLMDAENELNRARAALPGIECIVDEDMDPKNVMWDEGKPIVIDLECLERGNPVSSVLQLSLQWAGAAICELDHSRLEAFFYGYLEAYDNGFRDYSGVFGLAYSWVEWLEYNVKRALGHCADGAEREMGLSEAVLTLKRIAYLRNEESQIKAKLKVCSIRNRQG